MPEQYPSDFSQGPDSSFHLQDLEEKQRLLKERIILIGTSLIDHRESILEEFRELKKETLKLKEENLRMRDFIQNILNQLSETARKEELMILQRQIDILSPNMRK